MPNDAVRIGFQGFNGAYSHLAILDIIESCKTSSTSSAFVSPVPALSDPLNTAVVEPVACRTFKALLDRLAAPEPLLHYAVVPVENTYSGSFSQVFDALLPYHNRIHIVGEWVMREQHSL
jgi:prephenate dehydratase